MHYVANKKMKLAGTDFAKGEEIPGELFDEIPDHRAGALLRTRLIIEVETVPTPAGDMCPHCDGGPFHRLAQHISMTHQEVLIQVDETSVDQIPEESNGNS